MGELDAIETGKRAAAEAAIGLVEDGMLLGLGTGSTMRYAIEALGQRIRDEKLRIECVPTSIRTEAHARHLGIPLTDFSACNELDLAIDGADEVLPGSLHLIKGLGAALLREKIVAMNSREFVVVADNSKIVPHLGAKAPVPVEAVPFGHETVFCRLKALGARAELRHDAEGKVVLTDGGNIIFDCYDLAPITDPAALDAQMREIVGVVGTGLFPGIANRAFIADGAEVRILHRS